MEEIWEEERIIWKKAVMKEGRKRVRDEYKAKIIP
jgi:hypothetical protein